MKVALATTFLDLDDNIAKEPDGKIVTMYSVLRMASTAEIQGDAEGADAINKKMANYDVFLAVKDAGPAGEVELTSEQVTLMKGRIARVFSTMIVGPAARLLEGKAPYGEPKKVISQAE